MRIRTIIIAAGLALLAGCATSGEQNLDPLMLALAPKLKVLDFDAKTYIDAAAACNAGAAKDYNTAMVICSNPTAFVNGINAGGAGVLVPASAATLAVNGLTTLCSTDGFLPGMAMTIQQTTCPPGSAPVSAIPGGGLPASMKAGGNG